ncbi:hypothetical protein KVR01_008721 [Diaporthe batatas]|uniref:uncharacterized protein n=1 Tax=Diaporthe batatas TaxID=748121 RepID=UPI001D058EB0|nr:uncharacterized protein KVR01_008721 [Diaporthe batatas]KAG8161734.1 hypothetical protein KVR01_008721 [Diaporthe batatas]
MHKPDLEARIALLSRDDLVKVVNDLAADPTMKGKVSIAVDLAQSLVSDRQTPTGPSFFNRISKAFGRKPEPEAFTKMSTTSWETVTTMNTTNWDAPTPVPRSPGKTSIGSGETTRPISQTSSKESTTTLETPLENSKPVISDIQVCDNCHQIFRISKPIREYARCYGHPGGIWAAMFSATTSPPIQ